uniref:hypothetical protein n=1 Tax=Longispora albida TaxID=203523 RepID=UPI000382F0B7
DGARLAGSGFGGATFAGLAVRGDGATNVYYRLDGGPNAGDLMVYNASGPQRAGTGFGGATFAGVADWDRDGSGDVIYRIEGGPLNGNLYAYGASRVLIGTGFGGARFADVATWDSDTTLDLTYLIDDQLWIYGSAKYMADYGF